MSLRTSLLTLALVAMLVGLVPASGFAQEPPAPPPRGLGGERGGPMEAVALQQLLDSYLLLQAERQLQLTPAQAPQFIMRLRELQDARRRALRERGAAIQELRRLTQGARGRGGEVETQISDRLKSFDEMEDRSAAAVKQALANLDQVLEPFQRARFRILEEQLERNKLDILMQARRGRAGRL